MSKNLFINLRYTNTSDQLTEASIEQSRDPYYIPEELVDKYEISIDRFSIHNTWLPIFQHTKDLKIRLLRLSDNFEMIRTVDFTGVVDDNNLLWNIDNFIIALNNCLAVIVNDMFLPNPLTFTLDKTTFKTTFNYYVNFSTTYFLSFNEPLYSLFYSMNYANILFDQNWFTLNLLNIAPYTMLSVDPLEISPVDKIIVKCTGIPIISELMPPTSYSSTNSEAILTDFEFNGLNKWSVASLSYTATSGSYRMHSLKKGNNFNYIKLEFYYTTYYGNSIKMFLLPSGSVDVKLYLKLN